MKQTPVRDSILLPSYSDITQSTKRAIDKSVAKVLREAGIYEPPAKIERVLEHLELYREFYDLEDPSLLAKVKHKMQVEGRKVVRILRKIKFFAMILQEEKRVLIDASLPKLKQEFPTFHEATHRILKWHRPYYFGDTAKSLDPDCQSKLEAEANFGASALMFCGVSFTRDALDTRPCWDSVAQMKEDYGKNFVPTLRRYVEHSHDIPMAMMVSTAWWKEKPSDQSFRWRHFVRSPRFEDRFGNISADEVLKAIDNNTHRARGGPVGSFSFSLADMNGVSHEFFGESFFNCYYIQTLIVHLRQRGTTRIVLPGDN